MLQHGPAVGLIFKNPTLRIPRRFQADQHGARRHDAAHRVNDRDDRRAKA